MFFLLADCGLLLKFSEGIKAVAHNSEVFLTIDLCPYVLRSYIRHIIPIIVAILPENIIRSLLYNLDTSLLTIVIINWRLTLSCLYFYMLLDR